MNAPVAIAYGSNLGDRAGTIGRALAALAGLVRNVRASGLYETAPLYVEEQGLFLNGCLVGQTHLGPLALLRELKRVEAAIGRHARERNGPREIDLDLIAYGSLRLVSSGERELVLPHPRVAERRFVLEPLAEIAPSLVLPGLGSVADALRAPQVQTQQVRRIGDAPVPLGSG